MLTDPQIERYARHVLLREVGGAGQERLLAARVAVYGLGPAGAWATAYLALAGVGRLDLCDDAPVAPDELSPLLEPADAGRPRAAALAAALPAFNPDVRVRVVPPAAGDRAPCGEPADAVVPAAPTAGDRASSGGPADAVVLADPGLPSPAGAPVFLAFAAGDGAIVGPLDAAGPCAACVARALGPAGPPAPAAALLAGSLASTAVLARLAARADPAPGFLVAGGGALRRLEPAAIACPHRR